MLIWNVVHHGQKVTCFALLWVYKVSPCPITSCTLHQALHLLQLREMHRHVWKQESGIRLKESLIQRHLIEARIDLCVIPSQSLGSGTLWNRVWTCSPGCCTRCPASSCEEKLKYFSAISLPPEESGHVVVLQDGPVIVHDREAGVWLDMEVVRGSRVLVVVDNCGE